MPSKKSEGEGQEPEGKNVGRRRFLANGLAITGSLLVGNSALAKEYLAMKSPNAIDYEPLKKELKGTLAMPGDANYSKFVYSTLWNQLRPQNRVPNVVVRVADEQDVVKAVKFAKANNLKVVVRGGGHNWCCPSLRKGGMLVDLTELNKVISIDTVNKVAVLQPILSNREVQAALNEKGLSYPTGHCPQVKISGYLLGGGMSWNQGTWGAGTASVEAIELVTPDGELIKASKDEHQEYFWAARGGGSGFFGVAVRYHLKLYDLPKAITGSVYYFPLDQSEKVGDWLSATVPKLNPCIELSQFIVHAPKEIADQCKEHNGWACMVTATAFVDTPEEGAKVLAPFEQCPVKCLSKSINSPLTFTQLFDASGAMWPELVRSRVDAHYSNASAGAIFKDIWRHFLHTPSTLTVFLYAVFCGPNVPAPLPDCAFSMSAKLYGGPWTTWKDGNDDEANMKWHEELMALIKPHIHGYYVSESDTVGHPEYFKKAYSPRNLERLSELRKKYDPTGVFFAPGEGV